jgi:hypothetical protein
LRLFRFFNADLWSFSENLYSLSLLLQLVHWAENRLYQDSLVEICQANKGFCRCIPVDRAFWIPRLLGCFYLELCAWLCNRILRNDLCNKVLVLKVILIY